MDLHALTQNLYNSNASKTSLNVKLYQGVFKNAFKDVINEYCPMGKVAFVGNQNSFNQYIEALNDITIECGASLVSVVLDGDKTNTVEGISNLFTLPDDVRLVFYVDVELCQCLSYLSHVKNLPLVFLFSGILPQDLFSQKALIKNGTKLDQFKINPFKIIIFDKSIVEFSEDLPSKLYAYNISKLTALYDYRINSALSIKRELKQAYSLARQAILDTFNVFSCKQTEILDKLIHAHFVLNYANGLTGGELFGCSSALISAKLYGKSDLADYQTEFVAFFKVATLYSKFLSLNEFLPTFADYVKNATQLSEFLDLEFPYFAGCYSSQIKRYKGKIKIASPLLSAIEKEVSPLIKLLPKIKSTYLALKGEDVFSMTDLAKLKNAVKLSGDCTAFINGISLLREKGITYLID